MRRSFLALQGTASPFFSKLAIALRARGNLVRRINFCGGDLAYSADGGAQDYRDEIGHLETWYHSVIERDACTDVILFGDCREIHRPVHDVAQKLGVHVHVFEEGYVRPHWVTLERYGVNGRSLLPRDPRAYFDARPGLSAVPPSSPTGYNLYERAYHDIKYRLANTLHAKRYPHYRSHRPRNGFQEYSGLVWRLLQQRQIYDREAARVTRALLEQRSPYYLLPLQLNSDSQIVVHSPFGGVREAISVVMHSFARHAPSDSLLVVKNHPLDTGLIGYRKFVDKLGTELGVSERLRFIDAGHLPTLLDNARGVIVVNSTVGLSALHHSKPVIALGTAIYSMQGLTWQGSLEDFWIRGEKPDMDLYKAFLDYVIHHTQINGDFYTRTGIDMAVAGAVRRLEAVGHA
ncbi:capsule biosynthesis protein [Paraburkholderia silvatlantica]|uniref:Capsular polysaccharide export protein n=1 Tax=Paraburkholderia silvatlantica TaxID=321895 RepID=A0ABR6FZ39_9BURK|nr:capsular biosynthesis protein [Paraburkholderia silvatlantica]MBB2932707.1 capsular polysaccharide export protein [Paraburkholderia silvatlantica]PVY21457.1 capsular polysaccharide export protein [Paraburkholderia silvatlantica]PXW26054.1 capsular polysaccharide export protein [Paraburkholderia silvatlantica]